MEGALAERFYYYGGIVPMRSWSKFVRLLGLAESDIDDVYYENSDPSEQKYQMLSRWKSYYGYNRDLADISECLKLAFEELESDRYPELLNRKLTPYLNQNRQIARVFYKVMRTLHPNDMKRFAMTKLEVSDNAADPIGRNHARDFDEQIYQMFLVWMRRHTGMSHVDVRDRLEGFVNAFQQSSQQMEQAARPLAAPSGDLDGC